MINIQQKPKHNLLKLGQGTRAAVIQAAAVLCAQNMPKNNDPTAIAETYGKVLEAIAAELASKLGVDE